MDALPLSKGPSLEQALRQPKRWRAIYRGIQILCLLMVISGGFGGYLEDRIMQAKVDELIEQKWCGRQISRVEESASSSINRI